MLAASKVIFTFSWTKGSNVASEKLSHFQLACCALIPDGGFNEVASSRLSGNK